jgi:hypothetical protein
MTYAPDVHPEYSRARRELDRSARTFVLLPSLYRDVCVAETVRRQIARPFGRPSAREEAVIRARFEIYMAIPARKIETMRPVAEVVDDIVAALSIPAPANQPPNLRTNRRTFVPTSAPTNPAPSNHYLHVIGNVPLYCQRG